MNMKLIVLCLLAVCCSSLTNASAIRADKTQQSRKLREIKNLLDEVKENLQHREVMLHTPPQNIEDCCSLSALQCYQGELQDFSQSSQNRELGKLSKSLNRDITRRGMDFCESGAAEANCTPCHLHPKENANEFFNRLESFIQKGITRLSMD